MRAHQQLRLRIPTLAIDETKRAVRLAEGTLVEVLTEPTEASRWVRIEARGRTLLMFAVDLLERGEDIAQLERDRTGMNSESLLTRTLHKFGLGQSSQITGHRQACDSVEWGRKADRQEEMLAVPEQANRRLWNPSSGEGS